MMKNALDMSTSDFIQVEVDRQNRSKKREERIVWFEEAITNDMIRIGFEDRDKFIQQVMNIPRPYHGPSILSAGIEPFNRSQRMMSYLKQRWGII